eukprot:gene9473-12762_t
MLPNAGAKRISAIQKDWDDREFVEMIQLNIIEITKFLSDFDSSIRIKLATMNEKLNRLERAVEYCEAITKLTLENNTTEAD